MYDLLIFTNLSQEGSTIPVGLVPEWISRLHPILLTIFLANKCILNEAELPRRGPVINGATLPCCTFVKLLGWTNHI